MQKYRNKKITWHGMTFDSKKEMQRFLALDTRRMLGEIQDLQRQVKFVLIPAQYEKVKDQKTGKMKLRCVEREVAYYADFTYTITETGEKIVEDVKSEITRKEPLFVVKRKLMLWVHGIKLKEV